MKTINTLLIAFSMLLSGNVIAQAEESIFINGKDIFLHKNTAARLKSFLVRNAEDKTYLAWVTENLNYDGTFIIYRSTDRENYTIIGVQQTVRTQNVNDIVYSFIDNDPIPAATAHYKIMHLGKDNSFFTSDIITVKTQPLNFAKEVR